MTEAVVVRESYCSTCRRVIVGAWCGRCKRQLAPIAEGWSERSKQVKAALEAREQAQKIEETAPEVMVG